MDKSLLKNLSSNLILKGIGQTHGNNTCFVISIDIYLVAVFGTNSRFGGKVFISNTHAKIWSYVKVQHGHNLPTECTVLCTFPSFCSRFIVCSFGYISKTEIRITQTKPAIRMKSAFRITRLNVKEKGMH